MKTYTLWLLTFDDCVDGVVRLIDKLLLHKLSKSPECHLPSEWEVLAYKVGTLIQSCFTNPECLSVEGTQLLI